MTDVQTRTDAGQDEPAEEARTPRSGTAARRAVLAGAGAIGATCLLAACGSSSNSGNGGANPLGTDYQKNPAPAGSGPAEANGAKGPGGLNDDGNGGNNGNGGDNGGGDNNGDNG